MKSLFAGLVAALFVVTLSSVHAGDVKSGLQPGDEPAAFYVNDITGPAKGTSLCYRCKYGKAPVVSIFAREIDDKVASLIKQIDAQVAQNQSKKMKAFVVLLSEQPKDSESKLQDVAKENDLKNIPLTTFNGAAGPEEYKLSGDADLTVLMWVNSDVKVNRAFAKGELDKKAIDAILADTNKILN